MNRRKNDVPMLKLLISLSSGPEFTISTHELAYTVPHLYDNNFGRETPFEFKELPNGDNISTIRSIGDVLGKHGLNFTQSTQDGIKVWNIPNIKELTKILLSILPIKKAVCSV